METSGFLGPKDRQGENKRRVHISKVVERNCQKFTYDQIHDGIIKNLRKLIEALEMQKTKGKQDEKIISEVIERLASARICLDTYEQWWIFVEGVDIDEEVDKKVIQLTIEIGRSMIE